MGVIHSVLKDHENRSTNTKGKTKSKTKSKSSSKHKISNKNNKSSTTGKGRSQRGFGGGRFDEDGEDSDECEIDPFEQGVVRVHWERRHVDAGRRIQAQWRRRNARILLLAKRAGRIKKEEVSMHTWILLDVMRLVY